MTGNYKS